MPIIPQQQSNGSVLTGSTGPNANPTAFGANLAPIGRGLQGLASGVEQFGEAQSLKIKQAQFESDKRKLQDSQRWVAVEDSAFRRNMAERMAEPEFLGSENMADLLVQHSEQYLQSKKEEAPDDETYEAFAAGVRDYVTSKYPQALIGAQQNKVENDLAAVSRVADNAFTTYTSSVDTDPNALSELEAAVSKLYGQIEGFPEKTQKQLFKDVRLGMVETIMDEEPEYAEAIVKKSEEFSPSEKKQLLSKIGRAREATTARDRWGFEEEVENAKIQMFDSPTASNPKSKADYVALYGEDQGTVRWQQDNHDFDVRALSSAAAESVSWMKPDDQRREIQKSGEPRNKLEVDTLKMLETKLAANRRLYDTNRVGWMRAYHPVVSAAFTKMQKTVGANREFAARDYYASVMKYQGFPQSGDDQRMYQGRNQADRQLLGDEEILTIANGINSGNPKEVLSRIDQVLKSFPEELQYQVFDDLVNHAPAGKGISQAYQLAFQNRSAPWIDIYLGALSSSKDLAKISGERKANFESAFVATTAFQQLKQGMFGDTAGRTSELAGVIHGGVALAQVFANQGLSMEQAVVRASERLISETIGFTRINDQVLTFQKIKPDGGIRSQEEIDDIGRRLAVSLRYVDPRKIDITPFTTLRASGLPENSDELRHALYMDITANGFWQPGKDGQSASLYVSGDNGPIQVTDSNGYPFMIHFDELPDFTTWNDIPVSGIGGATQRVQTKMQPQKTYDITDRVGGIWPFGRERTNFPMQPDWIRAGGERKAKLEKLRKEVESQLSNDPNIEFIPSN